MGVGAERIESSFPINPPAGSRADGGRLPGVTPHTALPGQRRGADLAARWPAQPEAGPARRVRRAEQYLYAATRLLLTPVTSAQMMKASSAITTIDQSG